MKKRASIFICFILVIAVSVVFSGCIGQNSITPPTQVIVNQAEFTTEAIANARMGSVVEISSSFFLGSSAATGFLINESGYVLTNRHAVVNDSGQKAASVKCTFKNKSVSYSAKIIATHATYDLAVLKIEGSVAAEYNLFETALPADGAYCATIGNAQGRGLSVRDGVIGSNNVTAFPLTPILLSMPINHGNSGGPVYDKYGNVVAIVCSREKSSASDPVYNMGYGIGAQTITDYLRSLNVKYYTTQNAA